MTIAPPENAAGSDASPDGVRASSRRFRVLMLSWYFPPVNTIGALRTGSLARFLVERGHEIGVVAGSAWGQPETLALGMELERVAYAPWFDVNAAPTALQKKLKQLLGRGAPITAAASPPPGDGSGGAAQSRKSTLRRASELYVNVTNLPDNRIGWMPGAVRAALQMGRRWRPDLVFASGPPFSALLAARIVSSRLKLPWIAELRDRWADDPYGDGVYPPWRLKLDEWLERRVLATASGLVTVSEPWAEFYRQKYKKPVATVYNGYDERDFPESAESPAGAPGPALVIGYTGGIYPGRRDPTPLFEAIRLLGPDAGRVRIIFCGTDPSHVMPLAQRAGVGEMVEVRPSMPHAQSLEFQRQSDVLLLMQWNDPREQGNCPGKFFEYVASLRPLMILGLADGVPATIARARSAGFFSNDPAEIMQQLRVWLEEKALRGSVAALPPSAREGLSRRLQFERLERFLSDILPKSR